MISSPTIRQNDADLWIAPRSALAMDPPTAVWLAGRASPSTITRSPRAAAFVSASAQRLEAIATRAR